MKINTDPKKINELLTRGVEEVIVKEHLKKLLLSGERLRVKFGIDPTAPDIHLGHTVPLRKLRQFQEMGHRVVLIIGDFTATIGDPSARSEARQTLSQEQVRENMKDYLTQAGKVIDLDKTEVRYNNEWYGQASVLKLYELTSKVSVQRAMERDDFQKRIKQGRDVTVLELLYPLLQGYDSVMVKAQVELGGNDQKFNLLMGRRVQRAYKMAEQDIMTFWLLEGTDGIHKMSKSLGNYIALNDQPEDMYGKIMSIPDDLIVKYFLLLTDLSFKETEEMLKQYRTTGFDWKPRDKKARLAREIISMYHNKKAAMAAEKEFERRFQKKAAPENMPQIKPTVYDIVTALVESKICSSKSEARRVIAQGGVKINDKKVVDATAKIKKGDVVQKGSRWFVRIG
ncbi:MAG: tyrosine--tRNA ligase [bacterium]|nr:tyrosine--tRNA ligase [bacterium]